MALSELTQRIVNTIRSVPFGYVVTYGYVARLAGNPRAARQVSRVLHSLTRKEGLPWHRVINSQGRISLKPMQGYEEQRQHLENEGIAFDASGKVDLDRFLWRPDEF
ncbi:MGMT family protein [Pseudodesulfovibrio sp. zrk46]|uniref:MGMT family protein n=1 Tax=Pseudodesulfovibrio sp. zrk46 TaxID=2725288 RepID=UPI0014491ACB|nr:MGMT family protein [Pseudodesulfovibrio sp. zrk46]QJB57115.1 MGMT family protein [Pseudodesulfovibrio sp. zrk46]